MTGLDQYLACEWKDLKHAIGTVSAPQSTAASAAGIQATFIFVVGSLDKQIQNEKELIRLASAKGGGAIFCLCAGINLT